MDRDFWLSVWENERIRFHGHAVNPLLVAHLPVLGLAEGARLFLPLCGKSVDIGWLRARGFRVVGAELSPLAVTQLFDQMGEVPEIDEIGPVKRYRTRSVDVFLGDIFDLTADLLGPVDAVYDRAALVALPEAMRQSYAAHLVALSGAAPQLLSSYAASGSPGQGPPFPVGEAEIRALYGASHAVRLVREELDEPSGEIDQLWLLERPE